MPGPQTARNYCDGFVALGRALALPGMIRHCYESFFSKESDVREEARICLIRHGETAWNAELRIQGHRDLPLNGTGRRRRKRSRGGWRSSISMLYSSDLLRARQTVQPLAGAHGLAGTA